VSKAWLRIYLRVLQLPEVSGVEAPGQLLSACLSARRYNSMAEMLALPSATAAQVSYHETSMGQRCDLCVLAK
jgi:hypothetical protein